MIKKYFLLFFFIIFFVFTFSNFTNIVTARLPESEPENNNTGSVSLTNPLTGDTTSESIPTLLGKIIKAVLGVVGSIALVMFIFGGFTWMTAAGNAEKVSQGKNILVWATIGLVVIFTAYALVNFVFTSLGV